MLSQFWEYDIVNTIIANEYVGKLATDWVYCILYASNMFIILIVFQREI